MLYPHCLLIISQSRLRILSISLTLLIVTNTVLITNKMLKQIKSDEEESYGTFMMEQRSMAYELYQEINLFRERNGCKRLQWSNSIYIASCKHNVEMYATSLKPFSEDLSTPYLQSVSEL